MAGRASSRDYHREQQERELRQYYDRQVQQHGYLPSPSMSGPQRSMSSDQEWARVPQYPHSPQEHTPTQGSPRAAGAYPPNSSARSRSSPRRSSRSMTGRGGGHSQSPARNPNAALRGAGGVQGTGAASDFQGWDGQDTTTESHAFHSSASSAHLSFHTNNSHPDLTSAESEFHSAYPHTPSHDDHRGRGSPRRAGQGSDYFSQHLGAGSNDGRQRSFQGREGTSPAGSPLRHGFNIESARHEQQQHQQARNRSNSQHTQASYRDGYRPQVRGHQSQNPQRAQDNDQPGHRDLVDNARAFAAAATSTLFGAAQVGAGGALTGAPPSAAVPTTNLRDIAAGDYDHGQGSGSSRHSDPDSSATGSYVAAMEMDEIKGVDYHQNDSAAAALKAAGISSDSDYRYHGQARQDKTTASNAGGNEDSRDAEKIFAMYRNSGESGHTEGSYTDAVSMEADDDETPRQASARDLFRYATKWNLFFNAIGLVAAAAAGAAQPIMTIVFGNLTTAFLNFSSDLAEGRDPTNAKENLRSAVNKDALILVYIGCAMFVATYVYMAAWVYTGEEITRKIRERYLASVLRQNIAYFDKVGAGEITTRIQSDIHLIQEGISDKIPMTVSFIATFVAGFVVAYKTSWKLALAMTSVVPCIVIMGALMNVLMQKVTQDELDNVAKAATIAEESLSTVRTAKAFGIESRLVGLYDAFNRDSTVQGKTKAVIQGVGFGIFFVVIYCGYALAFYFGSKLIASGAVQSGTVMTVIFSIFIGAFSLALLAPNLTAWAFAKSAAAKIFETIDRVPEIDSSSQDGLKPAVCEGYIEVRNVSFRYPARRDVQVLAGYSVEIPRGKTTALVGASGSGKSTIVQLVERFYDPDAGQVLLDGVNLRDLNLQWLRSQIGLVSQEPVLFATTIRKNIGHGLINTPWENASEEEREPLIIDAAKKANIHATIVGLPNGYDTMVGERGFLLSGGQKQRIAIARAIVKNPRILLLDEATSALDTQSEGIVQDALDKAAMGRTTITIAHRLSTIKNADNIVVMGKGVILEQGRHEELLANPNGPYANLVNAQKIRANTDAQHLYDDDENEAGFAAFKAQMPVQLGRSSSRRSLASLVMRMRGENASQEPKRRSLFYLLYRLALINKDKIWTLYVPGIFGSIASGAVYPAFSILFGLALDNFSKCGNTNGQACPEPARSDMRHQADRVSLYMFITALLSSVCIAAQNGCLMLASAHLVERLRRMMMTSYLRADVAYFDEDDHSSGALSSSLAGNAQKINGLVGVTLGTILQSVATLIIGFAIALGYGWKLSLVCIACTPLTLSAGFVRLKLVVLKDEKIKKAHEGSSQKACEAASAIRTVASLTREKDCLRIFHDDLKEPTRITHNFAFKSNVLYALSQSLAFGVIALAFWYGSGLLIDQEYTSRQFFTVLTSVVFGSIQAGNVFNFVPDISNAHAAAEDTIKLIDNVPEIDAESDEGIVLDHCKGHVEFVGVRFRYPTRPGVRVLAGLDLEIRPGTYCALVGGSGCGKSTTIQLIERFYDPVVGKILIDGHDITTLNLKSLRRHIALVSQEPTLYDGTIAFNLRLGAYEDADKVTDDMLRKAASDANILEFIESLPNGFDTEVGGKGTQLSGGQKQRIAIARALIRDPKILLLDEATSALDSESEKVVQEALDKAARGRTTIAVAHRLSTISKSDRIFVLNSGIVSEMGTHPQLMALNGQYCELVKLQQLSGQE